MQEMQQDLLWNRVKQLCDRVERRSDQTLQRKTQAVRGG